MSSINSFINGKFLPSEQACLNIEDRSTLFGDGVYEVLRIYNGKAFMAKEHLDRLQQSASAIRLTLPYSRGEISHFIEKLLELSGVRDGTVYIQATRGAAPRTHLFPASPRPSFFMVARTIQPLAHSLYREGASAVLLPDERWKRCDIKSTNLLANVLAKEKAKEQGAFDAILFNEKGVTESTSSSVLAVLGGKLTTAPLGPWILPGITRYIILKIARENNIPVEERFFSVEEIRRAEEVMLASTTIEILPVVQLDGMPLGAMRPGAVFGLLFKKFKDLIAASL